MIPSVALKTLSASIAGAALIALATPGTVQALTLSSATPDPTFSDFSAGAPINSSLYRGWRFQINSRLQVTHIGGRLAGDGGNQPIFGAIVNLASPTAFPAVLPGGVVASTTFIPPAPFTLNPPVPPVIQPFTPEFRTPLSALLQPGNYALIFGSGLFNATGNARIPLNNIPLPGSSFFQFSTSSGGQYQEIDPQTQLNRVQFIVEGNPVHAPTPALLPGLIGMGIGVLRRRKVDSAARL